MALNGIQIFKLTPKKNCKECGCPTCMAFSMKVAQGAMKIEQCPHMSEDALASLSEATAPPMKTIKIGTGDGEFTLGGETVLFRHEKTFVSKTRYAVSLCTCMSDEEVEAKLLSSNLISSAYVYAKKNPMVGSLVCADVIPLNKEIDKNELKKQILSYCRDNLDSFKIPAILKLVDDLEITQSGKIKRG